MNAKIKQALEEHVEVLSREAKVPARLQTIAGGPLNWSALDVKEWMCSLGLESFASNFVRAEIDGLGLFDITEAELIQENLLVVIGARKRFLRARHYLASAYQIRNMEDMLSVPPPGNLVTSSDATGHQENPTSAFITNLLTSPKAASSPQSAPDLADHERAHHVIKVKSVVSKPNPANFQNMPEW